MKKQLQAFTDFVREQGVIGLAIGLVLGAAAKDVVDSLVKNLVNPLLSILLPNTDDLATKSVKILGSEFGWGAIVSSIISFLGVAAVVYFVFKGLKLDKADKKKS